MMDDQNHDFNAIIHFLSTSYAPKKMSTNQKKHLVFKADDYTLIVGHLYKLGADEILCHYVFYYERPWVMIQAHVGVAGAHYVGKETMRKILQAGLWWPTIHMDTKSFCRHYDIYKRTRKLLRSR